MIKSFHLTQKRDDITVLFAPASLFELLFAVFEVACLRESIFYVMTACRQLEIEPELIVLKCNLQCPDLL